MSGYILLTPTPTCSCSTITVAVSHPVSLSHRGITCALASTIGAQVISIDYRLAPENQYPAAVEDALAAYLWLLREGVEPKDIALVGDPVGESEILLDDATRLAKRLTDAGVEVEIDTWPDVPHMWQLASFRGAFGLPEGRRAVSDISRFLKLKTGHQES